MADWADVGRVALEFPEMTEGGSEHPAWRVMGKTFVWDRPLRDRDLRRLGDAAPHGPILEFGHGTGADFAAPENSARADPSGLRTSALRHLDVAAVAEVNRGETDVKAMWEQWWGAHGTELRWDPRNGEFR